MFKLFKKKQSVIEKKLNLLVGLVALVIVILGIIASANPELFRAALPDFPDDLGIGRFTADRGVGDGAYYVDDDYGVDGAAGGGGGGGGGGIFCGDGMVLGAEACDDGNTSSGDGCSFSCNVETGWSCGTLGRNCYPICGDVLVKGNEACDDGNTTTETACPYGTESCTKCNSSCSLVLNLAGPFCGDGIQQTNEACDDGNTTTETACPYGTETCTKCNSSCSQVLNLAGPFCGDGIQQTNEACDDGNTNSNDGCSATCEVEIVENVLIDNCPAEILGIDVPVRPNLKLEAAASATVTDFDWQLSGPYDSGAGGVSGNQQSFSGASVSLQNLALGDYEMKLADGANDYNETFCYFEVVPYNPIDIPRIVTIVYGTGAVVTDADLLLLDVNLDGQINEFDIPLIVTAVYGN